MFRYRKVFRFASLIFTLIILFSLAVFAQTGFDFTSIFDNVLEPLFALVKAIFITAFNKYPEETLRLLLFILALSVIDLIVADNPLFKNEYGKSQSKKGRRIIATILALIPAIILPIETIKAVAGIYVLGAGAAAISLISIRINIENTILRRLVKSLLFLLISVLVSSTAVFLGLQEHPVVQIILSLASILFAVYLIGSLFGMISGEKGSELGALGSAERSEERTMSNEEKDLGKAADKEFDSFKELAKTSEQVSAGMPLSEAMPKIEDELKKIRINSEKVDERLKELYRFFDDTKISSIRNKLIATVNDLKKIQNEHSDGKKLVEKCKDGIKMLDGQIADVRILQKEFFDLYDIHKAIKKYYDIILNEIKAQRLQSIVSIYENIKKLKLGFNERIIDLEKRTNEIRALNIRLVRDIKPVVKEIKKEEGYGWAKGAYNP